MTNIAINGFGRIGRSVLRAHLQSGSQNINILSVNAGVGDLKSTIHLFKYDSIFGTYHNDITIISDSKVQFGDKVIEFLFETDPKKISWSDKKVDIVLECTGKFTKKTLAMEHIASGAKKVVISAPAEDVDATIVLGVNEKILSSDHKVISIGSCTTNCLAPVASALQKSLGIEKGFMTTIHAYTSDQNLVDSTHKDLRRARAASLSMIPSSTGAAKALGLVMPELNGKLDGVSVRVPTPNVSMIDFKFNSSRKTNVEEVNSIMKTASQNAKTILGYTEEELVSIDFKGNPRSSIFDATQTKVIGGDLVRVVAWYDNEWGFSNRMLDAATLFGKL